MRNYRAKIVHALFLMIFLLTGFGGAQAAEHWQSGQTATASGASPLYMDIMISPNGSFQGSYGVYLCSRTAMPGSCRPGVICLYPCYAPKNLSNVSGIISLENRTGRVRMEGLCGNAERPFQVIETKPGMINMKIDVKGCRLGCDERRPGLCYEYLYCIVRQAN